MFWSLVRPDRILPPITRSAAVTTSLEADELAVGMITCEMFKGQDSWSSTPDQTPGVGPPDGWPFYRPIVGGGWFEKKEGAHRPGAAAPQFCNLAKFLRQEAVLKSHRS